MTDYEVHAHYMLMSASESGNHRYQAYLEANQALLGLPAVNSIQTNTFNDFTLQGYMAHIRGSTVRKTNKRHNNNQQ